MIRRNAILLKASEKKNTEIVHSCPANNVRGI
jgi:hypothetical protein